MNALATPSHTVNDSQARPSQRGCVKGEHGELENTETEERELRGEVPSKQCLVLRNGQEGNRERTE